MYILYDLIKPKNFFFYSKLFINLLNLITIILLLTSIYLGFYLAPVDIQQGLNYKIIFIHVPFAWLSLFLYSLIAIFSLVYLINKNIFIYFLAQNISKIGIYFTFLTLVTGSLWGKPMWGTYWVWDARLTSMLILFFFYLGYILLGSSYEDKYKSMNNSSILALIGFINIPIIKYSVEWWNTLHQTSSVSSLGSSIHISMLVPLLISFFAFLSFTILLVLILTRKTIIIQKTENLYMN
jgi:heme exporter protein CcmC